MIELLKNEDELNGNKAWYLNLRLYENKDGKNNSLTTEKDEVKVRCDFFNKNSFFPTNRNKEIEIIRRPQTNNLDVLNNIY